MVTASPQAAYNRICAGPNERRTLAEYAAWEFSAARLEAFFGENCTPNRDHPEAPELLLEAEVIIGIDVMTENIFVVFGRSRLMEIVEAGEPAGIRVLRIGIDQETDELEKLCAMVQTVKGWHEYESGEASQ